MGPDVKADIILVMGLFSVLSILTGWAEWSSVAFVFKRNFCAWVIQEGVQHTSKSTYDASQEELRRPDLICAVSIVDCMRVKDGK